MKIIAFLLRPKSLAIMVGLLLLWLLIWFFGPYLGFGNARPLAGIWGRVGMIVFSLVVVLVWWLVARWRGNRKTEQLASGMAAQEGGDRQSEERAQLQRRFREAITGLKSARPGRRGLYELPWYAIIGPPGSGKSTLLLNSGLEFPLADRFGKEAVQGVGGTRSCDWWFTSEAVFLDTAGRFATQDSDAKADAAAWMEFLELLRRYRPQQPLNGLIVAISALDLMTQSESELDRMIEAMRLRIEELQSHLGAAIPIYLIFTKLDLVAGFVEFFGDLNRDQRAQVWGMTFDANLSFAGKAMQDYEQEFALLAERVAARQVLRMQQENDPRRRAALFAFPAQFAALRNSTLRFVRRALDSQGLSQTLMLRGVYFTSGTQEGTPIDRMLGALARTFGIDAGALSLGGGQVRTFFVEKLLQDVLFPESGIAAADPKRVRRRRLLQLGTRLGVLTVGVLICLLLLSSYLRNSSYLDAVGEAIAQFGQPATERQQALRRIADQLSGLEAVVATATRDGEGTPLGMRWGLAQPPATADAATGAYHRALSSQLLPIFANHLRTRIIQSANDPELLYEYLRAYLMLAEPKHLEADYLAAIAELEWERIIPDDLGLRQQFVRHFDVLLAREDGFPPIALDQTIVDTARQTLLRASLSRLAYGRLKGSYAAANLRPMRLDEAAGLGAGALFVRESGIPLNEDIPALYTVDIFRDVVQEGAEDVVGELAADNWIFGPQAQQIPAQQSRVEQVLEIYEHDYAAQWRVIIDDLRFGNVSSLTDIRDMLSIAAGPTSPLLGMLDLLAEQTNVVVEPEKTDAQVAGDAAAGLAAEAAKRRAGETRLGRLLGGTGGGGGGQDKAKPGAAVAAQFSELHQLVEGAPGSTPIDRTLRLLATYRDSLDSIGSGMGGQRAADSLSQAGTVDVVRAIQAQAKTMPDPVAGWLRQLVGAGSQASAQLARSEIAQAFDQQVGQHARSLCRGLYPFNPKAEKSIQITDFGKLFGFGGAYDRFFADNLAPLVDTSGSRWRWRPGPGGTVPGSAALLSRMQSAREIRDVFFPQGAQSPQFRFVLSLGDSDTRRVQFTVDGQSGTLIPGEWQGVEVSWPGGAVGSFEIQADYSDGRLGTYRRSGPWALFRALEEAETQRLEDGGLKARFEVEGRPVEFLIQPASLRNPLNQRIYRGFQCD